VNLSILLHGASAASALWGAYLWFKASRVKTPDNFPIHILSTTPFSAEIPPTEIAVIGSSPELDAIGRALIQQSALNSRAAIFTAAAVIIQIVADVL
jgi:hypothetical protein